MLLTFYAPQPRQGKGLIYGIPSNTCWINEMALAGLSFSTKNKWEKNYFKGIVEKRKGWKTGDPGSSPGSEVAFNHPLHLCQRRVIK